MAIRFQFRRTRVARRMLALFVVCALLPIGIVAGISYQRLLNQLNGERAGQLAVTARLAAHTLEDRLSAAVAAVDRRLEGDPGTADWADAPVSDVVLIQPGGGVRSLLGGTGRPADRPDSFWEALAAAGAEPGIVVADEPPRLVSVVRPLDGGVVLAAHVDRSRLFAPLAPAGDLGAEVCVVDPDLAPVSCRVPLVGAPRERLAGALVDAADSSLTLGWDETDGSRLAAVGRVDIEGAAFGVVATAPRAHFADTFGGFRTLFTSVIALTLVGVFLLAHFQIRRSLAPLPLLREATARLAAGRFGEPVIVDSGDEFEELATSFNAMADQVDTQFKALTAMNEIGRAVLSNTEIDKIVETVLDRTPSITSCDAVLFLLGPGDDDAARPSAWRVTGRPVGATQAIDTTVSLTAEEIEELWNCSDHVRLDLNTDPRGYIDLVELVKRGVLYFAAFPIQHQGRVAGAIVLGYCEADHMGPQELSQGRRLADQVTVALSNARLIDELNQLNFGTLSALANTIDASSPWTAGHSHRVTDLSLQIGRQLRLPATKLNVLHRGGLLHDIGKIGTPPEILNKPGRLDPAELKVMQDHTVVGAKILAPIPQYADIIPIVRSHHERLDGKGYPDGLSGSDIPFLARVLAVADVFDALRSDRPYRAGWSEQEVITEIQRMAGTHLDHDCVEAFLMIKAPDQASQATMRKSIPYLSAEIDDFYTWID